MPRTPQEIFDHHVSALAAGDLDELLADYADDAVIISPEGAVRGKAGIRQAFTQILTALPEATWDVPTRIYEDDVLFIEWSAVSKAGRVTDGTDTLVFAGDGIRAQTVRFTLQPAD
jgi:ketosteroid isomerase-like protein